MVLHIQYDCLPEILFPFSMLALTSNHHVADDAFSSEYTNPLGQVCQSTIYCTSRQFLPIFVIMCSVQAQKVLGREFRNFYKRRIKLFNLAKEKNLK